MTNKYFNAKTLRVLAFIMLPLLAWIHSFAGGDHYSIYLNKKLVTEHHVAMKATALNLRLDKSNYNDEITVYYSHCGATGKGRSVMLKDDKGNIVKEWKFDDADNKGAMTIPAKEILDLQKKNKQLSLYYAAKELPKGMLLTAVNFSDKNTAAINHAEAYHAFIAFPFIALSCLLATI